LTKIEPIDRSPYEIDAFISEQTILSIIAFCQVSDTVSWACKNSL